MAKYLFLREDVIVLACAGVAFALASALAGAGFTDRQPRFERCLVGCAQTYAKDVTSGACARFADCVNRCEGK